MGEHPSIPKKEYLERMERCRQKAADRGLGGLVVVSRGGGTFFGHENVLYLTGHYPTFPVCLPPEQGRGHAVLLLPVDREPTLLVDTGYFRGDWVAVSDINVTPDLYTGLIECIRANRLARGRLGLVGGGVLSVVAKRRLDAELPHVSWEMADEIVETERMIKSAHEIDVIRRVGEVATAVGKAFLDALVPGVTEADVAAKVTTVMLERGAAVYGYYLTADWRPLRWPLANPERRLSQGDLVHSDLWGAVDGYVFDFSRSAVVGGKATPEQRELMEIAASTVGIGLEEIRIGMKVKEWVERIEARLDRLGYLRTSMTGVPAGFYGHGLGLAMEAPWIQPGDETELAAGMVLALERTMSVESIGCAMYEENFILTADGIELLTQIPRGF